ncbi:MAG TPA: relaxase/mobilization nuclease domain-containing protein [Cyclobacteriaceae bacterium]|nr:relaxase/mobilization nuclease domain-containing protein [Cyclobacteriaceae bacterium]
MTGKQIKGKGFGGALRYNFDKVDRKVAEVLDHNFTRVDAKSILREVMLVKVQRPNLQKFFYHTSINFPETENLSNERMKQIGREYLELNGFNQHQYIMFRHRDADHPHLHILVNRIGYDGSVVSDSNDYVRSERVIRELEKKHGLTPTIPSKQAKERSITPGEYQMMKRINEPSQKIKIQIAVQNILKDRPVLPIQDFINSLETQGVNLLFNQAKTGYVSGISYGLDGFLVTGSKLGNAYKWTTLKNTIDYEQERDGPAIHAANDRTRSLKFESTRSTVDPEGSAESVSTNRSQQQRMLEEHEQSNHGRKGRSRKVRRYKLSARSSKQGDRTFGDLFSKEPEESILGALLHSTPGRVDSVAGDQYYLDSKGVRRKKKRRMGRRM